MSIIPSVPISPEVQLEIDRRNSRELEQKNYLKRKALDRKIFELKQEKQDLLKALAENKEKLEEAFKELNE